MESRGLGTLQRLDLQGDDGRRQCQPGSHADGDVVAFLARDKASHITGETIYVDGGRLGMNYTC
jgi:NAD(P)-dependent dehydrogenase (short-subunit alcohol dehydrogenase family)